MSYSNENDVLPLDLLGKANHIIKDLHKDQILWLGGYLSGVGLNATTTVSDVQVASDNHTQVQVEPALKLKVLVGSHSGNATHVAKELASVAGQSNIDVELVSMADYKVKQLKQESNLIVIVSTHGEGEPPAAAEDLHRILDTKRAGDLSALKFNVIALGDSSYSKFCQTGIDFHERLISRGAKPLADPVLLDVDFKDDLQDTASSAIGLFSSATDIKKELLDKSTPLKPSNGIYQAEVLEKVKLNGKGSKKETYHVELSLEDSGLEYQPGDALEVFANNDEKLVDAILDKLALDASESVSVKSESLTLKQALQFNKELTVVTLPVLQKLSAYVNEPDLNKLLDKRDELISYLDGRDLLDVLNDFQFEVGAQELIDALRTLPPRAYSIASSQSDVGDEVHLTVGAVRYLKNEREHEGVCSTFIADRIEVDESVGVRVKQNDGFRLPSPEVPIIMVGPGTGVAPFRSFVQERAEQDGSGKNWLIFGDQHFETDFLYQSEWLKYREQGVLTKVDVAFSRDQDEKVYVQHRIKENADELYKWLNEGAVIYVCGDKNKMAKDVRKTFAQILQEKENLSEEEAEAKLLELRKSQRYQEDVY
ncbi:diflavin oxidoreductase [Carboxylicivirga sp. N1Y90]|uniref:diflavin oxidoreductase n=1 Tax=Carboxylicivirga fragile TaxID=3417571 RepID=UPI003D32D795|nr:flavodoxin domain-containing protein [Marinilabiliaceae bacterium N1Y90]